MASGKLSARQKMINLMYLVFIAMIAMQMSKEVLSAFGYMNEKLTDNNIQFTEKNAVKFENIKRKAEEQPEKYGDELEKVERAGIAARNFDTYIESLKATFLKGVDDPTDYEGMDKTSTVDEYFFVGDGFTKAGKEFLDNIATYKKAMIEMADGNESLVANINRRFDTSEQETRDGKSQSWLNNRYEGFPLISTITNLTSMQNDIKVTGSDILNMFLGGQLELDAGISASTYRTILLPEKPAFIQGESFKGKVVLGRYDSSLKPSEVVVNGKNITTFEDGGAVLEFPAGSIGEQELKGKFVFMQDGEPVEIPISTSYVVVPKPNSAVISADKMNVVYRGVPNPMTISIPGISDDKVKATGNGLKKISGNGKYIMTPGSGREVTIKVSGVMSDGTPVSSAPQKFRIKDIPSPVGTIRKQSGIVQMPKTSLEKSTIGAELPDFDFDLTLKTSAFTLKVPGQSAVVVSGNKMNAQAKKAIAKARRGDIVTILDIKSSLVGNTSYKIKNASPVSIEVQ